MADQSNGSQLFTPPQRVSEGAYYPNLASYEKMYAQSLANPEAFWGARQRSRLTGSINSRR